MHDSLGVNLLINSNFFSAVGPKSCTLPEMQKKKEFAHRPETEELILQNDTKLHGELLTVPTVWFYNALSLIINIWCFVANF